MAHTHEVPHPYCCNANTSDVVRIALFLSAIYFRDTYVLLSDIAIQHTVYALRLGPKLNINACQSLYSRSRSFVRYTDALDSTRFRKGNDVYTITIQN